MLLRNFVHCLLSLAVSGMSSTVYMRPSASGGQATCSSWLRHFFKPASIAKMVNKPTTRCTFRKGPVDDLPM